MRIVNVAGARPNFMKIAPLIRAMRRHADIESSLVHTGQHYDDAMSTVFFEQLGIPTPDINLDVGSGSREEQIERIMNRFEVYLQAQETRPDIVLVVGDVNSTIACVRVARRHSIHTVHVEAGLRSFDMTMPEEINRIETDMLSDLLFVTEQSGMDNLEKEDVPGKAFLVGNVMIDTLVAQIGSTQPEKLLLQYNLTAYNYVVGTFHRPSNVDESAALQKVVSIIEYAAQHCPVLLPLHPRTRNSLAAHEWLEGLEQNVNIRVTQPQSYLDFVGLVSKAKGIVTDSGGIQEETTYLGIPCITMRENTERPITVDLGTNVLAGTDEMRVRLALDDLFGGKHKQGSVPPYWDGRAAERIVDVIKTELS